MVRHAGTVTLIGTFKSNLNINWRDITIFIKSHTGQDNNKEGVSLLCILGLLSDLYLLECVLEVC